MRVFNFFFIIIFIVFAALQYNDPDPYVWMPLYLWGAWLCYLAIKGKYNPYLYVAGIVVYLGYATYLFVDKTGVLSWWTDHHADSIVQSMKATKPWIEETREFFGLMILVTVLVLNMVWLNRAKSKEVI